MPLYMHAHDVFRSTKILGVQSSVSQTSNYSFGSSIGCGSDDEVVDYDRNYSLFFVSYALMQVPSQQGSG